ncbi:MAG: aminotransferase class IV [Bacillota bacterium]|nr:aminotransferase class IV [Bacillota bacterium]MDW7684752.1 aminotransferase class IV [Bacillota bacterium]
MTDYYFLNGTLTSAATCRIAVTDRSYLLGDGLFETILVKNSKPVFLAEHLHRLRQSATFFAYNLPPDARLTEAVESVIDANAVSTGAIRLTVSTRESQGLLAKPESALNILVTFRYGDPYAAELYERGYIAVIAQTTRRNEHSPLSVHKTTNFADSILAKQEAQKSGADEAILLNTAGNLTEATVANLFLVKEGTVLTPPVKDGVLPGIIRQKVLELCNTLSIPAREQTLAPTELESAEEAFLTNSLVGIMPLAKAAKRAFAKSESSITNRLSQALNNNV